MNDWMKEPNWFEMTNGLLRVWLFPWDRCNSENTLDRECMVLYIVPYLKDTHTSYVVDNRKLVFNHLTFAFIKPFGSRPSPLLR